MLRLAFDRVCTLAPIVIFTLCSLCSSQAQDRLTVARQVSAELRGDAIDRYRVALERGSSALATLVVGAGKVRALVISPSGEVLHSLAMSASGRQRISVFAEEDGDYGIHVAGMADATSQYSLALNQVLSPEQRVSQIAPEPFVSPRIQSLRTSVEKGEPNAMADFLAVVRKTGAPIVEPAPGDPDYRLITFLWLARGKTRNVLVEWNPYSGARPQDLMMSELGHSGLWFKTLRVHKESRFAYRLAPDFVSGQPAATSQVDPLNPRRRPVPGLDGTGRFDAESIVELPDAPPQPWLAERAGVPKGAIIESNFDSRILNRAINTSVYTPPGYRPEGRSYPLLIAFGNEEYQAGSVIPIPTILDNLVAERKVLPMVAALVDVSSQVPANRLDVLCGRDFASVVHDELRPWLRAHFNVSTYARDIYLTGVSLGGLTAACTALFRPETAGNLIVQSGSFWWSPGRCMADRSSSNCRNWVAEQFAAKPQLPFRVWLEAGHYEVDLRGRGGLILEPTRHLRDVLKAKGYEVVYREFYGGHDYLSWPGNLADALMSLASAPH